VPATTAAAGEAVVVAASELAVVVVAAGVGVGNWMGVRQEGQLRV
jgi:hypothetical protein